MALYIIGDVQGCYEELHQLLHVIHFNPKKDQLGFVGDLVNRGAKSLETLRFIKSLDNPIVVLGNHDLHLLAVGYAVVPPKKNDSFTDVLSAPDKYSLLDWLRRQPLIHVDKILNYTLVHAGIPPQWDIQQALISAQEVQEALRGLYFLDFLKNMHGNEPLFWKKDLTGYDRLRYIVNALTRMRFCSAQGELDLINKTSKTKNVNYQPWFSWRNFSLPVVFGHWASLEGKDLTPDYYALDTGCVWGGRLTALRIEDRRLFQF